MEGLRDEKEEEITEHVKFWFIWIPESMLHGNNSALASSSRNIHSVLFIRWNISQIGGMRSIIWAALSDIRISWRIRIRAGVLIYLGQRKYSELCGTVANSGIVITVFCTARNLNKNDCYSLKIKDGMWLSPCPRGVFGIWQKSSSGRKKNGREIQPGV